MRYKVYHNPEFVKRLLNTDDMSGTKAVLAATVDATDLEDAYTLTNNIDLPWVGSRKVDATGHSLRSTSVGDLIQETGSNRIYVVETAGHRELGLDEAAAVTLLKKPE